jgi:type I restriction enzyme S subunit
MIAALGVPLPDLATQRSLAALLDRVQSLREQRTAAEPRLGSLLRMLYLERCGDPVTNPRRWPSLPFGRLGENQDALRSDPGSFSESRRHDATFPCYGASGVIQWSNHAPFDGPRLLVAESGTNLVDRSRPVARVVAGRFAVDRQAHVIGANGLAELRFLELSLELMELKPYLSGRSRARLTRASLERISVPLPPLALQRELCAVAERVESLRVLQGDSAARIDELSASLTRKLLRGELRI